jgi:hypothetical protein
MHNHFISRVSTLTHSQWRIYCKLRKVGFRPAVAFEIAQEWIE